MTRMRLCLLTLLAVVLAACTSRRPEGQRPAATGPLPALFARPAFAYAAGGSRDASISDIAERAVHSVVNVFSTRVVRQPRGPLHGHPFFDRFLQPDTPREQRAKSLGSGVIVTADGVVLTNNHVVENAQEIRVRLVGGRELQAKIVGTDPKSDLAVLRLQSPPRDLRPLPIGDSSKARLGEVVLAIGNPFGVGQTVTMGIVSAIGRANMGIVDYEDFIQTDAAINPGNSGGALVNMRAELIGINTAILSRSGGYQGIGFAIPTNMARPIMISLIKSGRVVRGWLGVMIQDLNEEMARALRIALNKGVLVTDVVPDGPAARAGLRRDDVITHIDGVAMDSSAHLRNRVGVAGAEGTIKVSALRGGKTLQLTIKLSALPSEATATLDRSQGALGGLTLDPLTDETRQRLGLPPRASGVLVKSIDAGSAAQDAGLQERDVILQINRQPVANPTQFATIYRQASGKILLLVYRSGSALYLLLEK
jgi:serine protease Do